MSPQMNKTNPNAKKRASNTSKDITPGVFVKYFKTINLYNQPPELK
ncbi:unnamed protein product [marine sediment metagenome]|uniref:Uncharacterized protein n=1 Tax=marine sediment metagenome TaxID=412755 RepID=X1FZZ9_9ZZZZ